MERQLGNLNQLCNKLLASETELRQELTITREDLHRANEQLRKTAGGHAAPLNNKPIVPIVPLPISTGSKIVVPIRGGGAAPVKEPPVSIMKPAIPPPAKPKAGFGRVIDFFF